MRAAPAKANMRSTPALKRLRRLNHRASALARLAALALAAWRGAIVMAVP